VTVGLTDTKRSDTNAGVGAGTLGSVALQICALDVVSGSRSVVTMPKDRTEQDVLNENPLADWCSLCGRGYHPNLVITIADEPSNDEYRWSHNQCKHDHDMAFLDMFGDENDRSLDTRHDGGQDGE